MRTPLAPLFALVLFGTPAAFADGLSIDRLVDIFQGHSAEQIDDVVRKAKEKLSEDVTEAKKVQYEAFFDSQMKTLVDKGVPTQIVQMLSNQHDDVIAKALKTNVAGGNTVFLPVIPLSYLSPYMQMAMVENDGKKGYNHLQPNLIENKVDVPDEPYFIYDVEDGEAMRGKSPNEAEELLNDAGRNPLTVAEVASLALHTGALSKIFMDATGSRFEFAVRVPVVWLGGGEPRLDWNFADYSDSKWGSPSCGSR